MKPKRIWAVWFSGTGTTKKVVRTIADEAAAALGTPRQDFDFTPPQVRERPFAAQPEDLVIFGVPVYAGRVPNVLLPYLSTLEGNGAFAVPVVLFGNRNFDDALIELRDILQRAGFSTVAGAAFVGEHSFSTVLAAGRPDQEDISTAVGFAQRAAEKVLALPAGEHPAPICVEGIPFPYRGYYQPRDRAGHPIDIRKVKPLTNDTCDGCGVCVDLCPMGSIQAENVREVKGICIKCGACVKGCPKQARYYADEGYLYHRCELEEGYPGRASVRLFL